jgi:hypothetical protein
VPPKEHDRMQVEIKFDMFIFRRCDELGVSSQEIKWDDLARKREGR